MPHTPTDIENRALVIDLKGVPCVVWDERKSSPTRMVMTLGSVESRWADELREVGVEEWMENFANFVVGEDI